MYAAAAVSNAEPDAVEPEPSADAEPSAEAKPSADPEPVKVAEAPPAPPTGATLPKSVTHFGLNSIALLIVLGTMYALRTKLLKADPVFVLCCAVAVPVVVLDVLVLNVHKRSTTGIDWDRAFTPSLERVILKVAGLLLTLAPFAAAYSCFPEYAGAFYNPFYNLLLRFWPGLVASSILYIVIVDGHMREPKDTLWRLGRLLMGKWEEGNRWELGNHYRGWLVKAFFFPLMFVWLNNSTFKVVNFDLSNANWNNLAGYDFLYDFIFFIDLLFTTVGYALCFRPIDTHIRTAEPTFLGWGVALFCYEPFFSMLFEKQYVKYGGVGFGNWLSQHPMVRQGWGLSILLLITIYVLATVAFGVRFSNLTHRGILTNGPYRFTKHPAYVSKNASWWLVSVPFILMPADGVFGALRRCLLLGCVNFVYFMRARTEERHLSRDPTYVAYALWMNEHGALRFLNRIRILGWRVFQYKPPPLWQAPQAGSEEAAKPYL